MLYDGKGHAPTRADPVFGLVPVLPARRRCGLVRGLCPSGLGVLGLAWPGGWVDGDSYV